jgi:Holliday junction resolvase RusA-like endonuclease
MINFFVPGTPVPKARARVVRQKGFTRSYTPAPTAKYEQSVRFAAFLAYGEKPFFEGPVRLLLELQLEVPKSWSKKKQAQALAGAIMPTKKPDTSNVLKSIEDAMNMLVYKDDSQICQTLVRKVYHREVGAWITVERIDGCAA